MGWPLFPSLPSLPETLAGHGFPLWPSLVPMAEGGSGIVPPPTLLGSAFATWAFEQWRMAQVGASASLLAAFPSAATPELLETLLILEADASASATRRQALLEAYPLAARLVLPGIRDDLEIGSQVVLEAGLMGAQAAALITGIEEVHNLADRDGGATILEFRYRWI